VKANRFIYLLFIVVVVASCNRNTCLLSSNTNYYNISSELPKDSITVSFIQPYADSLNITMQKVIGYAAVDMPKAKPESLMGNFFCDALLGISKNYFSQPADLCIMNYGGLRIPTVSQGDITIGRIYELMPFDNFLVLMNVKGSVLQEVLHHVAKEGGWPVSGLKMNIVNGKAENIFINNEPIAIEKEYQLLISDYMAEGGDRLEMLKNTAYDNSGVFVRDALIDYITQQKNIHPVLDSRIQYAE